MNDKQGASMQDLLSDNYKRTGDKEGGMEVSVVLFKAVVVLFVKSLYVKQSGSVGR